MKVIPHVRICAGGRSQGRSLPRLIEESQTATLGLNCILQRTNLTPRSVVQFNAVLQFCVDTLSSRDIYQPLAEGPKSINKFMSSVQSLGNVKMRFGRAFRKMV
jgi:hypothetical protein